MQEFEMGGKGNKKGVEYRIWWLNSYMGMQEFENRSEEKKRKEKGVENLIKWLN